MVQKRSQFPKYDLLYQAQLGLGFGLRHCVYVKALMRISEFRASPMAIADDEQAVLLFHKKGSEGIEPVARVKKRMSSSIDCDAFWDVGGVMKPPAQRQ